MTFATFQISWISEESTYLSNRILVFENNKLLIGQHTQKLIVLETNYLQIQ